MNRVREFLDFVRRSPTAFQAAAAIAEELKAKGFRELKEVEDWDVVPGDRCYVTRNGSSVIAFTVPQSGMAHFQIVSSHSDSPTFKLKPVAEDAVCGKYVRLNTERYGGMLMATWLDRPLSIAGRALVRDGAEIASRLVDVDRDSVLIPNMPIHFNREVNDGFKYNPQVDLLPLFGDASSAGKLKEMVAQACGAKAEDVIASDLFLYNRTPGSIWGANEEYFSCPRIDDLECAWTSLQAFIGAEPSDHISVYAVFDNEEVGSGTKQGADSTFLEDVLNRAAQSLGATDAQIRKAFAASFMVSADNAHAVHPNHPEKYDVGNRTFMNEGVVIKHNANQKYTTDGVSAAIFASICEMADVPVQNFSNRSDILGGSTLGNISTAHVSMNTVDIGLAQLAMHSCYETAGVKDVALMIRALKKFYEKNICFTADGVCEIR